MLGNEPRRVIRLQGQLAHAIHVNLDVGHQVPDRRTAGSGGKPRVHFLVEAVQQGKVARGRGPLLPVEIEQQLTDILVGA